MPLAVAGSGPSCKGGAPLRRPTKAARGHGRSPEDAASLGNETQESDGTMSSTFDRVAGIIAETADIPREQITPRATPSTTSASTASRSSTSRSRSTRPSGSSCRWSSGPRRSTRARRRPRTYFVLRNLVAHIDALAAARKA
jgi:hypothetical protein